MSKYLATLLTGATFLLAACGGGDSSPDDGSSSSSSSSSSSGSSSSSSGSSSSSSSSGGALIACSAEGVGVTGVWPDASNTGVPTGTVLTPSGPITVSTEGAVVENLDITGSVTVLANNVTIRKVRITSDDYYPIRYFDNDNTGLVVEDSEIIGLSGNATAAISFRNYTARRLNVHGTADGFKADANVLIEDCWIHDLSNGPEEHNDGIQATGGPGVTVRRNNIADASNAAVMASAPYGTRVENLRIENNLLAGGAYTLNIRGTGELRPTGTRITSNCFVRNAVYGPWVIDDANPVINDNHYSDGSAMPAQ